MEPTAALTSELSWPLSTMAPGQLLSPVWDNWTLRTHCQLVQSAASTGPLRCCISLWRPLGSPAVTMCSWGWTAPLTQWVSSQEEGTTGYLVPLHWSVSSPGSRRSTFLLLPSSHFCIPASRWQHSERLSLLLPTLPCWCPSWLRHFELKEVGPVRRVHFEFLKCEFLKKWIFWNSTRRTTSYILSQL